MELLAHHCAEAGRIEKAIVYWGRAGRQALTRSAMFESIAQIGKGLALLTHLAESPERWRQELDAWLERLPESLEGSATAEKLQAITEIDLDQLLAIDPPRGYGRD
jgi:predicted ATPase